MTPAAPPPRDPVELERRLGPRLLALFLGGVAFFGYPILDLFSRPATIGGVPLLFVYLFAAWAIFIALTAWLVDKPRRRR